MGPRIAHVVELTSAEEDIVLVEERTYPRFKEKTNHLKRGTLRIRHFIARRITPKRALRIFRKIIGVPIKCRGTELTVLSSVDDEPSKANSFLINLSIEAIKNASTVDLKDVSERIIESPLYPDVWPGEHYKLLAGMVLALKPKLVLEIGTGEGLSALSMKKYLPRSSKLVTFDIIPWDKTTRTCLESQDFNESLMQYTDDLSDYSNALKHKNLLESADIVFVDAAKDGVMEYKLLENFKRIKLRPNSIICFDDIYVWNMLKFWRDIEYPKINLTSFGHWTGTGVIQWLNK